jgi:lactobin A/cerein 7B family class IIb bacteriocin
MKSFELEEFGTIELNFQEIEETKGGFIPAAIWIGIGIGVGSVLVYDFICGFYTGVKNAL